VEKYGLVTGQNGTNRLRNGMLGNYKKKTQTENM
jgi:hypothetical protein